MTAVPPPGTPTVQGNLLVSTSPASGDEAGRVPVAAAADVERAVERAHAAGQWWAGLGFDERRERLLRWRRLLAQRMEQLAELMRAEAGKPVADALVEIVTAVEHIDWAARNAQRVLGPRRVRSRLVLAEFSAHLEYQPHGVIGVIGPWNYPVFTPVGSIAYALAAGNAVVFKPSEYTPVVGQWLVDSFAEVVPEHPVLVAVHGLGDTGAALCRAGVDKLAFTGSTATAKKVMATCAESLTPVLLEAGGKDAMIVDADADLDAAAEACVWGAMTNAGQTCIGIERAYVVEPVFDEFVDKVVDHAGQLTVGPDDADIGPITMPSQLDVIRRHIEDAVTRGGRAVLGGPDAVRPPYAHPTVLVEVPEDAAAVREETFGPTLTVNRVRTVDEALSRANALPYGLGGSVFGQRHAVSIARRLRSGMASINSTLTFAGMSTLPFGGVGESGFGRIHGEDGLREFARTKSVTRRRSRSLLPSTTFRRTEADVARLVRAVKLLYGR
ncbi:aldehyde dehydrogenase family protein [Micromonospora sp. HNM0581]|uniref:aldehyde dehydrogenase family protein n=1 Tax=Micromonospora sp. HNM0581 TaxID=2716341 RepID=UPI00146B404C|nr:aldehyde dehydrogenase family protein [Micromonospora sp. HNM0581]NLU80545.1 aldehyde dehydrogenase family protein [Micromonospora sp. HNM0581]